MNDGTKKGPESIADLFDIFHLARSESAVLVDIWSNGFARSYAKKAKPKAFAHYLC